MSTRSLILSSVLAVAFVVPAKAQDTHRYVTFFKYTDASVKAMTENPQDRAAQIAKLAENFGGKMEAAYWFGAGGEYDGMTIGTFPTDENGVAQNLFVRSSGSLAKVMTLPLMTSEEFKAAMQKAKDVKATWTAPPATKQ
jgi:uncharacterized protein with GYD domain